MADWFNFSLYALQQIVSKVFSLNLGLGFTLGDFEVACLVIGMIATALIIKTGSFAYFETHDISKKHFERISKGKK